MGMLVQWIIFRYGSDVEMNNLQKAFGKVGKELGLNIGFDREIVLCDGTKISAMIYVEGFGGPEGNLVFGTSEVIWPLRKMVIASGYGYSVMSIPENVAVDVESYREVLLDWGWAGPRATKPHWVDTIKEGEL
jgi:hypothetical protein